LKDKKHGPGCWPLNIKASRSIKEIFSRRSSHKKIEIDAPPQAAYIDALTHATLSVYLALFNQYSQEAQTSFTASSDTHEFSRSESLYTVEQAISSQQPGQAVFKGALRIPFERRSLHMFAES
jgi:hypothetical protein